MYLLTAIAKFEFFLLIPNSLRSQVLSCLVTREASRILSLFYSMSRNQDLCYLWQIGPPLKHRKVPECYDQDCWLYFPISHTFKELLQKEIDLYAFFSKQCLMNCKFVNNFIHSKI